MGYGRPLSIPETGSLLLATSQRRAKWCTSWSATTTTTTSVINLCFLKRDGVLKTIKSESQNTASNINKIEIVSLQCNQIPKSQKRNKTL